MYYGINNVSRYLSTAYPMFSRLQRGVTLHARLQKNACARDIHCSVEPKSLSFEISQKLNWARYLRYSHGFPFAPGLKSMMKSLAWGRGQELSSWGFPWGYPHIWMVLREHPPKLDDDWGNPRLWNPRAVTFPVVHQSLKSLTAGQRIPCVPSRRRRLSDVFESRCNAHRLRYTMYIMTVCTVLMFMYASW